ncbi:MAG: cell division protein ZapB [Bryobacteraceae bacterium]
MAAAPEQAIDTLSSLEERITHAVQVITELREENGRLQAHAGSVEGELSAARGERDEANARAARLESERAEWEERIGRLSREGEDLRNERKEVKSRIEKLLSQLDLLSAS